MGDGGRFESLISRLPIDNDKLIGQAVGWFIQKQDPDAVEFKEYKNGYQIHVYAEGEAAKKAAEFWEEFVEPHLGGNE